MVVLVLVGVLAGGAVLWARPVPFVPQDTPGLRIDEAPLAAEPPLPNGDAVDRAAAAIRSAAALEGGRGDGRDPREALEEARRAVRALEEQHGTRAVLSLRQSMTEAALDAVEGGPRPEPVAAFLGSFEEHLGEYGALVDGELRAPRPVLRSLLLARWNRVAGRLGHEALEDHHAQAYWGWLALEATGASADRRLEALHRYLDAGGEPVPEAHAFLLLQLGRPFEAAQVVARAREDGENLRLRNLSLALIDQAAD